MQIGEIERDVDAKSGTAKNFMGNYTRATLIREGKKLFKKYPEYKYLKNDQTLKNDNDFFESVVYAYMIDQILKNSPDLEYEYKKTVTKQSKFIKETSYEYKGKSGEPYSFFNNIFLQWYQDYLREQADPGCIERERKEAERKQQALKDAKMMQEMHERIKTQQDLDSGKRVVCPYCKSTNTEKISTVSRAVSVSLVGAASGKIGKQWHCKQCGSNF
jgi:hypothetical protein